MVKYKNGPPLTCGPQVNSNWIYIYIYIKAHAKWPTKKSNPAYNFRCFVVPSTLSRSSDIPLFFNDSAGIGGMSGVMVVGMSAAVGMVAASVSAAFDSASFWVEQRERDGWPSRASRHWIDSQRWAFSCCSSQCIVKMSCKDSLVLRSQVERCLYMLTSWSKQKWQREVFSSRIFLMSSVRPFKSSQLLLAWALYWSNLSARFFGTPQAGVKVLGQNETPKESLTC